MSSQMETPARTMTYPATIESLTYSPDSSTFSAGLLNGTICVADVQTGETIINTKAHSTAICALKYSPDGKKLVSISSNGVLCIWRITRQTVLSPNPQNGSPGMHTRLIIHLLNQGHAQQVGDGGHAYTVAWSPDSRTVASDISGSIINLTDADTGGQKYVLNGHTDTVLVIEFSPDGRLVASTGQDATVRVWDVQTGDEKSRYHGVRHSVCCSLSWTRDGQRIVIGTDHCAPRILDAETGKVIKTLLPLRNIVLGEVRKVAYSLDETLVSIVGGAGRLMEVDVSTGDVVKYVKLRHQTFSAWFSADMRVACTLGARGFLQVWALESQVMMAQRYFPGAIVSFAPDGKYVLTTADDGDTLHVWDLPAGTM